VKHDKTTLHAELCAHLEQALAQARAAHAAAIEGAFHPEAKAENDKDTRGLEQSYLARGQAQRVVELETALADVTVMELRTFTKRDKVLRGALVQVGEDDSDRWYFLAPGGGGTELSNGVQVITPVSPLGRVLLGKQVGDSVELRVAAKVRELEILDIA
jgi:transcription elongation GreA/GreB family factor